METLWAARRRLQVCAALATLLAAVGCAAGPSAAVPAHATAIVVAADRNALAPHLGQAESDRLNRALVISHEIENTEQEARVLEELAQLRLDEGDRIGARRLLEEAVRHYDALGLPETTAVRLRLASLS